MHACVFDPGDSHLRFNGRQGLTVETDHSLTGLDESHGGSSLNQIQQFPILDQSTILPVSRP
jgi:hypothetical protein